VFDRRPLEMGCRLYDLIGDAIPPDYSNLGQVDACYRDAAVLADVSRNMHRMPAQLKEEVKLALSPVSVALRRFERLRFGRTAAIARYSRLYGVVGQWENRWAVQARGLILSSAPKGLTNAYFVRFSITIAWPLVFDPEPRNHPTAYYLLTSRNHAAVIDSRPGAGHIVLSRPKARPKANKNLTLQHHLPIHRLQIRPADVAEYARWLRRRRRASRVRHTRRPRCADRFAVHKAVEVCPVTQPNHLVQLTPVVKL